MQPHSINLLDNFIAGWYNDNLKMCDKLLDHYYRSDTKGPGRSYDADGKLIVDSQGKKSIDCPISDVSLRSEYLMYLQQSIDRYILKYPFCNYYLPWTVIENFQIQHYLRGDSFNAWHTERGVVKTMHRHLVFMTYLNDVNLGGETEFFHQKIKIKPEKGLTVIWPSDWTYTHRGLPSNTEEKFIITGWLSYVEPT